MTKPKKMDYDTWEALELERLGGFQNGGADWPGAMATHRQGRGQPRMNPICYTCGCELQATENDAIIQHEDTGARYAADIYECPTEGCTTGIVKGLSRLTLPPDFRAHEKIALRFRNNPK
jgi:hypothetical protein